MAEKKTAKRSKSSLSKKKLTALEKHLCSLPADDKLVTLTCDGVRHEIKIKPYIELGDRNSLMEHVRDMYFPAGSFDKNHGDTVLEFILFQLYTGVTFDNDIELFDRFAHSDYFKFDPDFTDAYLSEDYYSIKDTVEITVNAMLQEQDFSVYREEFYKNFNELFNAIHNFIDNADVSLSEMANSMQSEDGVHVKELLEVLNQLNKKDERKIVNAVLDFQENKAKRTAASRT